MFCPRCGMPSRIPNRCMYCNYIGLMVEAKNEEKEEKLRKDNDES